MHIPTLLDATPGIEKGGSLRSRPPVPARRSRPGGRGATASRTTASARGGPARTKHVRAHIDPGFTCAPPDRHRACRKPPPRHCFPPKDSEAPARSVDGVSPARFRASGHLLLAEAASLHDTSCVQIVQSIIQRNRMMACTKRSRRSYGAGEWGRNRVRVFFPALLTVRTK